MTGPQYRAALETLGQTQVGAARLFKIGERTSRRWAEEGVTGTAETLIKLMLAGLVTVKDIEKINARKSAKN
jgi:hypothetical protein